MSCCVVNHWTWLQASSCPLTWHLFCQMLTVISYPHNWPNTSRRHLPPLPSPSNSLRLPCTVLQQLVAEAAAAPWGLKPTGRDSDVGSWAEAMFKLTVTPCQVPSTLLPWSNSTLWKLAGIMLMGRRWPELLTVSYSSHWIAVLEASESYVCPGWSRNWIAASCLPQATCAATIENWQSVNPCTLLKYSG